MLDVLIRGGWVADGVRVKTGAAEGAWQRTVDTVGRARRSGLDVLVDTTPFLDGLGMMAGLLPAWLLEDGLVRKGSFADVVVFDYQSLGGVSTVDQPLAYARAVCSTCWSMARPSSRTANTPLPLVAISFGRARNRSVRKRQAQSLNQDAGRAPLAGRSERRGRLSPLGLHKLAQLRQVGDDLPAHGGLDQRFECPQRKRQTGKATVDGERDLRSSRTAILNAPPAGELEATSGTPPERVFIAR